MNVYFLLDRSGSMVSLWSEAIASINAYVANLKKDLTVVPIGAVIHPVIDLSTVKIMLATFDSSSYDVIRNTNLTNWKDIDTSESYPRGMTNLYDSCAKLINAALIDNPEKAILITMTDGAENCSAEYNNSTFKQKLKQFEDKNWEVVFLGANFDVDNTAISVGLDLTKTMSYGVGQMTRGMGIVASSSAMYFSSSDPINFTQANKAEVSSAK